MPIVNVDGADVIAGFVLQGMEKLSIQIPALQRPTLKELQRIDPNVKSIERDTSPSFAVEMTLITVLDEGERKINGDKYERRCRIICLNPLHMNGDLGLGYQHANWLVKHQNEFPALMNLCGRFEDGFPIYIDFPGLVMVFRGAHGGRHITYLMPGKDGKWHTARGGFDRGFYSMGRVAIGYHPGR